MANNYVGQAAAWDKAETSVGWTKAPPEGKCVKCKVPTVWIDPKGDRRHPWCATDDMFVARRNTAPLPRPPQASKDIF